MLVWYRKSMMGWRDAWRRVFNGLQAIPELQDDIKGIKYFVTPNGGGSLMDTARRMESAIEALTARLEILAETTMVEHDTDEAIARFHCAPSGENVYVNQTYARWLGVGKNELLGWNFLNVIHPEDVHRVEMHWHQCREEHRQYRMTHRVVASNGEVIKLAVTCTPIPESGPALRWIGHARRIAQ
jgi:PAS domain S-box-containing protein